MIDLSILYVDNDEQALASFSEFYSTEYNIDTAASIKQALIKLNKSYFDIVFSEYNLTSMNGIEFLRILTQDFPTIPVVLVTNQPSETLCREAFLAGATDVIDKISGITKNKLAFNAIIEKSLKTKTPVVSKDSGDNYFQLANSLPVGLILVEERAVCFANRAAMDFLGFDNLDELVGRALIDFIHKDHRLEVFNIYEQLKRPGKKIKPRIHKWIDATGNPSQVKVNMSSVALQGKVLIQFIFEQLTGQQMMGILSDRLSRLSKDYEKNLNLLVSAVGELCGADLAVYQKVEEGKMVALGKWNTPDGFVDSIDYARCIGSEVVRQGLEAEDLVVLNVGCTKFIRTDLNLKNADFRKLIGAPVFLFNNVVGALSL
ncbi:MAG: response regulator, partial [Vulcanimicrobiota bacterium]